MKFFYHLTTHKHWGLLILRLTVGVIFIVHGIQKWALWNMQPSDQMPAMMLNLMKFLSIVEPLGGLALIFGFLTQLAALGLSLIMLGAIFWFKMKVMNIPFAANNTTGWEFDLILLASNIALILNGAGRISLDYLLAKK